MPFHQGWLPREGFTADVLGRLIRRTALNPVITSSLIALAAYTRQGQDVSQTYPNAVRRLRIIFYIGLARVINNYLSRRALNNGVSDKFSWDEEIAVVTGGSDGIGKHIVHLLAESGLKVAVLDVQPLTFDPPPQLKERIKYYSCDIRSPAAIASAAAQIRSDLGSDPTVLINNAGIARGKTILDASESDIRLTLEVNAMAPFFLAKEFVPSMAAKNHGIVVTVASVAAYLTAANMVDYAASKSAAVAFHEGLATELRNRYQAPKVRTVLVTQGFTKTAMFEGWNSKGGFLVPLLEPESVAEATVRSVLSGKSGQVILPPGMGGLTGLRGWPEWMQLRMRNNSAKLMQGWKGRQIFGPEAAAATTAGAVKEQV